MPPRLTGEANTIGVGSGPRSSSPFSGADRRRGETARSLTADRDGRGSRSERGVLVTVEFAAGLRTNLAGAAAGTRGVCPSAESVAKAETPGPESSLTSRFAQSSRFGRPSSASPSLDPEESLAEFRDLLLSAGGQVAAELIQRRPHADPATLIGSGKVEETAAVAASTQADLVVFDHDLSPTQLRNLESALSCRVLDRTQLILDIFARHARTREGQLQVELAQLEYLLPRLTGRGKAMSQLGGGIGTRGPGETQLETDRRRIQRRIDRLKSNLESVRRTRRQQRQRREAVPVPTVALVGYTNAGKSTLFNFITGAQVLSSSRMFATLDPKLRSVELPSRRRVLLSDTVGFIRNLPHALVTSFRATLEEVAQAEVLIHVRDAASTYGDEQKAQVEKVLGELESLSKPRIEVLNKIDLLPEDARQQLLESATSRGEIPLSALTGQGIPALRAAIDCALHSDPVIEADLRVPQHEGAALASIEAGMIVHSREYEGNLVHLAVSGPASLIGRMRRFRARDEHTTESM